MMTTDGFIVQPLEFPGGNIGSLAVHGTVNDLAVSGAIPCYLSLNVFIEEGLEIKLLERIINSLGQAAKQAGVYVVAGDTKVIPRGQGSGLTLATTGIGYKQAGPDLSIHHIQAGDCILVSGPVGDHGTAIMLAREEFGISGDLQSDAASVYPLTHEIMHIPGLRFMRDPTRGGLATVMHEILQASGFGIRLEQDKIPIRDPVSVVCEMLGFDPLYLACEGRVVAVIEKDYATIALQRWQQLPQGKQAAIIGQVTGHTRRQAHVVLKTLLGGERILEELEDEPLPRIC
ncbi:hydrogenase expression/formation protein HypE [bacterium BMS3Bbin11]|nr:hydrogenase expression/formation protein HypE [bacterium BMS3Bbin11]